ncbi:MAG: GNAT family N-acetyltransferase [Theionarchaea archaeon]|nr:MAG: hypothetical protein AYK19_03380 [Theionarchaea archaeon DG-70-1]MBU7029672.1 GNAT family N-acetyltransferase [Theionarchaea archaeon]
MKMIYELDQKNYEKVRPLFKEWKNTAIHSAIDKNTFGKIYVDNPEHPQTALAWGAPDMFFLAGDTDNEDFNKSLDTFISKKIAPEALERGLTYFAVQVFPVEKWEYTIKDLLKDRYPKVNYEWTSVFNKEKYTIQHWKIPPGFSIEQISKELLKKVNSERDVERIKRYWGTIDTFLEKGFGFYVVKGDKIITSCISCYVSKNEYEIGIITYNSEDRNKGFATATAQAFVDFCVLHNLTPVWRADMVNPASITVAERVGFEKVTEYPDYYFYFDELDNLVFNGCYHVREKELSKAEEFFEKAFKSGELNANHYYKMACAWASVGETDTALKYLKEAVDKGFSDVKRLTKEIDLKGLQGTKGWEELVKRIG